ncbi:MULTISPECIES: WecB/TagA/CpsF family glycosyltransferase [Kitasatospora]|uniref:WecB/TagA/CpsF family glycosyltransferase n=1 Tax=Kitasatospora cystarginea TaxID=58350 RepID=A0ABN3DLV2_9ACTN
MEHRQAAKTVQARDFKTLMDRIRIVGDEPAEQALLDELTLLKRPFVLSFVNAHAVNLGWRRPEMLDGLFRSDLLLRDGIGMKLGMRVFGRPYGRNMNGTDFIPAVCRAYRGRRVALFGTRSPWLDNARRTLESWGLTVVATREGFDPPEEYVGQALAAEPDLVLLAMGMPKQEAVSMELRAALSHPVLIVNGGAVLDHLGGKVPRAPLAMRRAGLEWLFRLAVEPRRLFGRYVIGIPVFCSRMAALRLRPSR